MIRKCVSVLSAACLVYLLCAGACLSMTIKVVDDEGRPIANAKVGFRDYDTRSVKVAVGYWESLSADQVWIHG